ncbi:efflux RND transporter periplasmic adaptor subunit [Pedobacter sp. MC2016-15]|uniref:efflux RND transporter periplasmic adaptor subunit n=1 Tax=Pedobacter sp. MC2016-15 TaxID=2994473 RepID=UPI002246E0B6|nr:efflux RND transporter periplasmic adaptor subunit [Pedobacter sp. MC2016-15]MCX2480741.1 efflux RND transporter periplasmic adaptor subunit [Pedobacter sp. MC2016-15]
MKMNIQMGLLLLTGITLASCGGNNKEQAGQAGAAQVQEYKVLTLQPRSATLNTDFPASIQGQENIEIRPRIEGYLEKIYVDEGAVVKKGQPLFKINDPQYEQAVRTANAGIKTAEAQVSTAKLAVVKVTPLVQKEIVSKYELESAQYTYKSALASLASAKAALVNAQTNLSYTTVTSPVNGVVGSIPFRLGSLVNSSNTDPLTTVSSIGNVYAYFALNEKLLLEFTKDSTGTTFSQKIAKMPKVSLLLSDGSLYREQGRIETVNGLINTATGSANIRARFPNAQGVIRSGSSTTVRIPNAVKDAILIPQSATYELQDKRFAVVVDKDGKTKTVAITVMENTPGNYYIVESGLKAGDQVALEGVATLKDGTQIKANVQQADAVYADLK